MTTVATALSCSRPQRWPVPVALAFTSWGNQTLSISSSLLAGCFLGVGQASCPKFCGSRKSDSDEACCSVSRNTTGVEAASLKSVQPLRVGGVEGVDGCGALLLLMAAQTLMLGACFVRFLPAKCLGT